MLKRFVVLVAVAMVLGVVVGPSAAQGQGAQTLYAVTEDNSLIRFSSSAPATIAARAAISGLQPGEAIVGIDFRPANGQLYALGDSGRLYTVDLQTAAATPAGAATPALSGVSFGVDFNPVADRLRIVSNDDQNLRVNVETGEATVDGRLAYAAGDRNAGVEPTVIAAAYTSSVAGATSTTLYVIGGTQNVLATQNPPNEGVLNTVGPLGLEVSTLSSFDIAPGSNTAFLATATAGRDLPIASLYTIDLDTGTATLVGVIGEGQPIRGLAVAPAAGAPAAPAAKPAGQPTPAPKPVAPAPAAKPAPDQPAPAAKPAPVPAPVQAPRALPRTGQAENWLIGGLALAGAGLLGAGLVARRRRA